MIILSSHSITGIFYCKKNSSCIKIFTLRLKSQQYYVTTLTLFPYLYVIIHLYVIQYHMHTRLSILQGCITIKQLIETAVSCHVLLITLNTNWCPFPTTESMHNTKKDKNIHKWCGNINGEQTFYDKSTIITAACVYTIWINNSY